MVHLWCQVQLAVKMPSSEHGWKAEPTPYTRCPFSSARYNPSCVFMQAAGCSALMQGSIEYPVDEPQAAGRKLAEMRNLRANTAHMSVQRQEVLAVQDLLSMLQQPAAFVAKG